MKELILGGARSGKSRLAQQRALASGLEPVYLATATAGDAEMAERIARHRAERGPRWLDAEEPRDLAGALQGLCRGDRCVVVDCLTLWLSNLLCDDARLVAPACDRLLEVLPTLPGHVVLVSNEVGLGLVPESSLGRRFRDEAGRLHQALATLCGRVTFVAAGLPLTLKGTAP